MSGKKPWYAPQQQRTTAGKIIAFGLHNDWELRPLHLGIWVFQRGVWRIFATFSEAGDKVESAILVHRDDEGDRELTPKQFVHLLQKLGRLYYPTPPR